MEALALSALADAQAAQGVSSTNAPVKHGTFLSDVCAAALKEGCRLAFVAVTVFARPLGWTYNFPDGEVNSNQLLKIDCEDKSGRFFHYMNFHSGKLFFAPVLGKNDNKPCPRTALTAQGLWEFVDVMSPNIWKMDLQFVHPDRQLLDPLTGLFPFAKRSQSMTCTEQCSNSGLWSQVIRYVPIASRPVQ